jgi:hypothetical protein
MKKAGEMFRPKGSRSFEKLENFLDVCATGKF